MNTIQKIVLVFVPAILLALPVQAAKWGKIKTGECNYKTEKREYSARFWRKPFDRSAKKICKKYTANIKGKKRTPNRCEKKWHQGYVGYWDVADKTCSGVNKRYQLAVESLGKSFRDNDGRLYKKLKKAIDNKDKKSAIKIIESQESFHLFRDAARDRDHETITVSVAADASLFVGLGVDISGLAFDTEENKDDRNKVKWFSAGSGSVGISIAVGGNIVFGSFEPPNYCLGGKSFGYTTAFGLAVDYSHTSWYDEKVDRKAIRTDLAMGFTNGFGLGLGVEAVEFNTANTLQFISDEEKEECDVLTEERKADRSTRR